MPLSSDFYGHSFDKVTEKGSYIREPDLYKVDKYFKKAG
jgi:hypothetical protein